MPDLSLEGPSPYPQSSGPGGKGVEGLALRGGTWFLYCSVQQLTQAPVQLTPIPTNWTVNSLVICFWKKLKKHVRGISSLLLSEKQSALFNGDWQLLHKLINKLIYVTVWVCSPRNSNNLINTGLGIRKSASYAPSPPPASH